MAAWITIYVRSRKRVPGLATIREALGSDWWTLGEAIGLEEDAVDVFMASLAWSDEQVGQPGKRPMKLHVWREPARVRTELEELSKVPASVKLGRVIAVIALELGISQLDTMLEVVGFEIAYWLAEHHEGVIKADNGSWFDHAAHRWDPFT